MICGMTADERLRATVRDRMRLHQLTQAETARALRRTQSWLSKRLSGRQAFRLHDLDLLATLFNMTVPELFFDTYGQWDRRTGSDRRKPENRRKRKLLMFQPAHVPRALNRIVFASDSPKVEE